MGSLGPQDGGREKRKHVHGAERERERRAKCWERAVGGGAARLGWEFRAEGSIC